MPASSRDRSWKFVKVGIGLLFLAAIVAFVDIDAVAATARRADLLWISAAIALLPVNILLESEKWRLLVSRTVCRIGFRDATGSVLAGYALGFVTPARSGDYAGRALYLADRRKGELFVMSLLDRLYSFWIYVAVGTAVLSLRLGDGLPGPEVIWRLLLAAGLALSLIAGLFVIHPRTLAAVGQRLLRWRCAAAWRDRLASVAKVQAGTGVRIFLLSLVRYGVFCTQFVFLILAFSHSGPLEALYAGVALAFFVKTIVPSVSIFDLGIRESAAILFLGLYGVASAAALNASLLLFAINLALPACAGAAFVPELRWRQPNRSGGNSATVEAPAA